MRAIRTVLTLAIRAGGTTLRDYVGADGEPGYFRQKLYVYERAGKPCRRCRTPVRAAHPGAALHLLLSALPAMKARGVRIAMSRHIQAHLAQADAVMAALIGAVGAYALEAPEDIHPFQALAQAIAHQQLNGTAANTILAGLTESCGGGRFPTPQCVLEASVESLRAAGFSFAKVAALKDLAAKTLQRVRARRTPSSSRSTDEEIIDRLTQVRGIGRWTVEMLLMFQHGPSGRVAGR